MLLSKRYAVKGEYMYIIKRNGFAMILAIFVLILVALGGVMLLSNATLGTKLIGNNYLHTQAELLAASATEFAVMRAQGHNTGGGACLNNMNITVQDSTGANAYDINVTIRYSFRGAAPGACNILTSGTGNSTMMLIDTTVVTNSDADLSTEPIRIFKRSWQKL